MDTGMKIGNEMHKDGVGAVADALVRLMQCGAEQKTIREAIKAFSRLAEVKNVSVSNCSFVSEKPATQSTDFSEWLRARQAEEEQTDRMREESRKFLAESDDDQDDDN